MISPNYTQCTIRIIEVMTYFQKRSKYVHPTEICFLRQWLKFCPIFDALTSNIMTIFSKIMSE